MSRKNQRLIRTLFAVPSAVALAFSATQALASPPAASRAPNCNGYCENNVAYCEANPTNFVCRYCGCIFLAEP